MELTNNWYSNLGFYLELKDDSPVISGNFYILSKKIAFKGVDLKLKDGLEISFIINWDINTLTAFSGRLIKEDKLHLKWLLFIEDKNSTKIEQYNGDLLLTNFIPPNNNFPDAQFILPYPKILLADTLSLSWENAT